MDKMRIRTEENCDGPKMPNGWTDAMYPVQTVRVRGKRSTEEQPNKTVCPLHIVSISGGRVDETYIDPPGPCNDEEQARFRTEQRANYLMAVKVVCALHEKAGHFPLAEEQEIVGSLGIPSFQKWVDDRLWAGATNGACMLPCYGAWVLHAFQTVIEQHIERETGTRPAGTALLTHMGQSDGEGVFAHHAAAAGVGAGAEVFHIGGGADAQAGGEFHFSGAGGAADEAVTAAGDDSQTGIHQGASGLHHRPTADFSEPFLCDFHFVLACPMVYLQSPAPSTYEDCRHFQPERGRR